MNSQSRKFFTITFLVIFTSILIGMLVIEKSSGVMTQNVPSEVERLSYEYLENLSNEAGDSASDEKIKMISYQFGQTNTSEIHNLIYEIEFPEYFMKYSIRIINNSEVYEMTDINLQRSEFSLEKNVKFTLENKTSSHYFILFSSLILLIFTIYSAAICFGTTEKNKWRRSLIVLSGVCTMLFNWNTGEITYNIFSIAIPAVSINYGPNYSVYSFAIHIPVGLLIYWLIWRKEITRKDEIIEL